MFNHFKIRHLVYLWRQNIMVSPDKHILYGRCTPDQCLERQPFTVELAMKQIADNGYPGGSVFSDELPEPVNIVVVNRRRNGNARFAKMPGFAQMQVSEYE